MEQPTFSSAKRWRGWVIAIWVLAALSEFVLTGSTTAHAASCTSYGFGHGTKHSTTRHYGTGANLSVISLSPIGECPIVRSAYIWNDANNEAEVGWFQVGTEGGLSCLDQNGTPHVLIIAFVNSNIICIQRTPGVDATQRYWLQNINHDKHIQFYWDKGGVNYLGELAVDFNMGESWAYDEIHGTDGGDNLVAHEFQLQWQGGQGGWNDWDTITHWTYGDVSGSRYCQQSSVNWRVRLSSEQC